MPAFSRHHTLPIPPHPFPRRVAHRHPAPARLNPPAHAHPPAAHPPATPPPTFTPSPSPTPTPAFDIALGLSPAGNPLTAHVVGEGPLKVVIVGQGTDLPARLLDHFRAHPRQVPPTISLWIVPEFNPDGAVSGQHVNAAGVDLYRNADTRDDHCGGNTWTPDPDRLPAGSGGAYPFSAPESQALRRFVADAGIVLFYQQVTLYSDVAQVSPDSCRQFAPNAALASLLTGTGHYASAPDYGLSGNWVDYLSAQGIAGVRVKIPPTRPDDWASDLLGVQRVLALVDDIVGAEAANQGASFVWLEDAGINEWQFAPRTLIHPLALAVLENTLYLLDSGRVLALDLDTPAPPRILLAPGDQVENTRVLEPLDLAAAGPDVLVLDRAGDVYRYDRRAVAWHLERSDRHNEAELSDYFVALAANADTRFLLESNYEYIRRYQADGFDAAWLIPDNHDVDLDAAGEAVYLLSQEKDDIAGRLLRYQLAGADVSLSRAFRPAVTLLRPRQVAATATTVYVLDEGGRRLLSLDPAQGQLQTVWQRRDARPMTALWADAAGGRLIVAGRDRLWFYGMPAETTNIQPGATVTETLHDAGFLAQMNGWLIPIGGSDLPARDLQMPGAPRHYRLGIHEGVDFYWQPGTLVRAAASGRVIRAMTDYVPAGYAELTAWRAETLQLGYTSAAALDGYRGQQVWIEHENGLVTRYAHLSQIAPGIEMGVTVTRGQVIGAVGNSGSPASLISPEEDAHLHFEVWLGDQYLGQFLRPVEIREWLRTIFMAQ